METLQTTIETELQSKENNAIVLWAMDYKEAHDEMGFEVTVPQLIEMLISFKKEFTDKDWYNAGIMAQRILQNDEIETLKKKLKQEEFNHTNTRISWDETSSERDELKIKNKALEERIVQLMSQKEIDKKNLEADRRTIAHAVWTAAANGFPVDDELKILISNIVINKMESIGFEPTENTATWFANEVSEQLVTETLESIVQWQAKKLN